MPAFRKTQWGPSDAPRAWREKAISAFNLEMLRADVSCDMRTCGNATSAYGQVCQDCPDGCPKCSGYGCDHGEVRLGDHGWADGAGRAFGHSAPRWDFVPNSDSPATFALHMAATVLADIGHPAAADVAARHAKAVARNAKTAATRQAKRAAQAEAQKAAYDAAVREVTAQAISDGWRPIWSRSRKSVNGWVRGTETREHLVFPDGTKLYYSDPALARELLKSADQLATA